LWIRGNDDGSPGPEVVMTGANIFAGRGILVDGTYGQIAPALALNYYEFQGPCTPTVMLYGTGNFANYTAAISSGNNDSQPGCIIANWCPAGVARNVTLNDVVTSGAQNLVTGSVITNLLVKNVNNTIIIGQRQNSSLITTNSFTFTGIGNNGALSLVDTTGLPMIDNTGTWTQRLTIVGGTILSTASVATTRVLDSETVLGYAGSTAITGSVVSVRGNTTIATGTTITSGFIYGAQ